jgi:sugar/nucleoside kinase (ribokinase family)
MSSVESILKDVVGIGNAMVDVLIPGSEAILIGQNLLKGGMILIDRERAIKMHQTMDVAMEMSGGSVGNTMAGIVSLGGSGSYIGKVSDDDTGVVFSDSLESLGISFAGPSTMTVAPTARCLVIITPDGQRSMATYLGACVELGPEDIDQATMQSHQVTYIEGYLWDAPLAKQVTEKAASLAHAAGRKVALTLSDASCVERHVKSFRDFAANYADILFANEEEIKSLYRSDSVLNAIDRGSIDCDLLAITRGVDGALISSKGSINEVDAFPVANVVDTTGAGDLFAAGFLYGITHGYSALGSGRLGSIAAGEIVSHFGARPEANLRSLVRRSGI